MNIIDLENKMIPVLKTNGVIKASLFGSTGRGEAGPESDVDIIVELEQDKTLFDLAGIKIELEEVLHKKVDVLTYDGINPLLRDAILSEQNVFYEKR